MQDTPQIFDFLLPIWGRRHIDYFMGFVAPSLLAPGNLPALAGDDATLVFLTRRQDRRRIEAWDSFKRLSCHTKIRFLDIDRILTEEQQAHRLHRCYQLGLASEPRDHTRVHFVFLNSDVIFADGDCRFLRRMAGEGVRCLMEAVFRANVLTLLGPLSQRLDSEGRLCLPPRELVEIGLQHMHPATVCSLWDEAKTANRLANRLYWRAGSEGLLARNYLMHPLMVRPVERIERFEGFVDYAYVPMACPDPSDRRVITDSDDFFRLEFADPLHETYEIADHGFSAESFMPSLASWTTREHRDFARTSTRYHVGRKSSQAWAAAEVAAQSAVEALERLLPATPQPAIGHPFWGTTTALEEADRGDASATPNPGLSQHLSRRLRLFLERAFTHMRDHHRSQIDGHRQIIGRIKCKGLDVLLVTRLTDRLAEIREETFHDACSTDTLYLLNDRPYPSQPIMEAGGSGKRYDVVIFDHAATGSIKTETCSKIIESAACPDAICYFFYSMYATNLSDYTVRNLSSMLHVIWPYFDVESVTGFGHPAHAALAELANRLNQRARLVLVRRARLPRYIGLMLLGAQLGLSYLLGRAVTALGNRFGPNAGWLIKCRRRT